MTLKERQQAMRRRVEIERGHQQGKQSPHDAKRTGCGQGGGRRVTEDQSRLRPTKSAEDDETPSVRLLDLRAAGTYLGLSYWTMRDLVFGGLIPTVKIPCPRTNDGRVIRRLLIDRRDLDAFIEKNKELEQ